MNTLLTPTTRHTVHPHPPADETSRPVRRVGLLDRAALHLGMALIRWGRRPGRELERYERRATTHELALLRRERLLAWQELERQRTLAMSSSLMRMR